MNKYKFWGITGICFNTMCIIVILMWNYKIRSFPKLSKKIIFDYNIMDFQFLMAHSRMIEFFISSIIFSCFLFYKKQEKIGLILLISSIIGLGLRFAFDSIFYIA